MTQPQQPESKRPTPAPLTQEDLAELKQSKTVEDLLAMVQQKIDGRREQQKQLIAQQQEREQNRRQQNRRLVWLGGLSLLAALLLIGIFALRPLYCPRVPVAALCGQSTAEPGEATPPLPTVTVTEVIETAVPARLDTVALQSSGTSKTWTWAVKAVGDDGSALGNVAVNFSAGEGATIANDTVTTDAAGMATATIVITDGTSDTLVSASIPGHDNVEVITENIAAFVPIVAVSALDYPTEPVREGERIAIRFTLANHSALAAENVRFSLQLPAGLEREQMGTDAPSGCDPEGPCHWDRGRFEANSNGDLEIQLLATTAGEISLPANSYSLTFDGATEPTFGDTDVRIVVEPYAVATIEINPTLPYLLPGLDFTLNVRLLDADGELFTQPLTITLSTDQNDILLTDDIQAEQLTTSTGELVLHIPTLPFENAGSWDASQPVTYTIAAGEAAQPATVDALPAWLVSFTGNESAVLRAENSAANTNIAIYGLPQNTRFWIVPPAPDSGDFFDAWVALFIPTAVDDVVQPSQIPGNCWSALADSVDIPPEPVTGQCVTTTDPATNQSVTNYALSTILNRWPDLETITIEDGDVYRKVIAHGWIRNNSNFVKRPGGD